jgi:hypothetical protein
MAVSCQRKARGVEKRLLHFQERPRHKSISIWKQNASKDSGLLLNGFLITRPKSFTLIGHKNDAHSTHGRYLLVDRGV